MRKALFLLVLSLCPVSVCPVSAQTYTGSIGGKVTDASGLPVAHVAIAITEENTNTTIRTESNETGDYTVSYLKPGSYKAAFTAQGFREYLETGVLLQINQQRRIDPALQVGQVSETVQVVANGAQVNYVSPEIGQVI